MQPRPGEFANHRTLAANHNIEVSTPAGPFVVAVDWGLHGTPRHAHVGRPAVPNHAVPRQHQAALLFAGGSSLNRLWLPEL